MSGTEKKEEKKEAGTPGDTPKTDRKNLRTKVVAPPPPPPFSAEDLFKEFLGSTLRDLRFKKRLEDKKRQDRHEKKIQDEEGGNEDDEDDEGEEEGEVETRRRRRRGKKVETSDHTLKHLEDGIMSRDGTDSEESTGSSETESEEMEEDEEIISRDDVLKRLATIKRRHEPHEKHRHHHLRRDSDPNLLPYIQTMRRDAPDVNDNQGSVSEDGINRVVAKLLLSMSMSPRGHSDWREEDGSAGRLTREHINLFGNEIAKALVKKGFHPPEEVIINRVLIEYRRLRRYEKSSGETIFGDEPVAKSVRSLLVTKLNDDLRVIIHTLYDNKLNLDVATEIVQKYKQALILRVESALRRITSGDLEVDSSPDGQSRASRRRSPSPDRAADQSSGDWKGMLSQGDQIVESRKKKHETRLVREAVLAWEANDKLSFDEVVDSLVPKEIALVEKHMKEANGIKDEMADLCCGRYRRLLTFSIEDALTTCKLLRNANAYKILENCPGFVKWEERVDVVVSGQQQVPYEWASECVRDLKRVERFLNNSKVADAARITQLYERRLQDLLAFGKTPPAPVETSNGDKSQSKTGKTKGGRKQRPKTASSVRPSAGSTGPQTTSTRPSSATSRAPSILAVPEQASKRHPYLDRYQEIKLKKKPVKSNLASYNRGRAKKLIHKYLLAQEDHIVKSVKRQWEQHIAGKPTPALFGHTSTPPQPQRRTRPTSASRVQKLERLSSSMTSLTDLDVNTDVNTTEDPEPDLQNPGTDIVTPTLSLLKTLASQGVSKDSALEEMRSHLVKQVRRSAKRKSGPPPPKPSEIESIVGHLLLAELRPVLGDLLDKLVDDEGVPEDIAIEEIREFFVMWWDYDLPRMNTTQSQVSAADDSGQAGGETLDETVPEVSPIKAQGGPDILISPGDALNIPFEEEDCNGETTTTTAAPAAEEAPTFEGENEPHTTDEELESAIKSSQKPLSQMSEQDVAKWLRDLGFPEYRKRFISNNIDGVILPLLDHTVLKTDMGISSYGHRAKILEAAAALPR